MKIKVSILLVILVFFGCSANITKKQAETPDQENKEETTGKRIAEGAFIDGSILEIKGQYKGAVEKYLEAANYDPQPGIFYALAKTYYKLNKLSSAVEYAKKSAELEPNNKDYLELLASVYSASLLADSAINVYKKIISVDSTDPAAYFQLAQLYEPKRPNEALALYKKVIDLVGPDWSVLVRLVDLNERMGNVKETIKTVEELIKLNPSDLQLQKVLIESYIKVKDYDKALKSVNESLVSFPDDLGLSELKGNIFLQQGKWDEAYDEYIKLVRDKSITYDDKLKVGSLFLSAAEKDSTSLGLASRFFKEISKDSADWQVNAYLGEIELKMKHDSLATGYFKKAASLAEWNSQLWIRLGGILFDNRKYAEAINTLDKAVEKFPNDFAINLIYGLSLSQKNEFAKAKIYLQRALNINSNDMTALSALGYTLNQLKEDDDALKLLNKALELEPDNVQVISQAALIYESQKKYSISDSLYNHALKIDSTNVLILNNYSYSLAERNIRLEEALRMSQKAVNAEPKNSSYLDTIGWIYYMLGDYGKAKKYIEESLAQDDKSGTVNDHLGDVLFKLGDKSAAFEYWKKAANLEPNNEKFKTKIEKGTL